MICPTPLAGPICPTSRNIPVQPLTPTLNGSLPDDPWEGLDIPDYLRRDRPRLGPPAISAGPDDDLGDLQ
jgi:hypothetical protein